MKTRLVIIALVSLSLAVPARPQDGAVPVPEAMVAEGLPEIPESIAETAGRYAAYRSASFADWHPERREMLIATRFGETPQLHVVKMPGGARQQLTFFADSVGSGRFHP